MQLRGLASLTSVGQDGSLETQGRVELAVFSPNSLGQQAGNSSRVFLFYSLRHNFFFWGKSSVFALKIFY